MDLSAILSFAHHDIIDANGQDVYLNWGLDALFTKLQQFMNDEADNAPFFVFVDRHSRKTYAMHLVDKFRKRNHQPRVGFNTPGLVGVAGVWDGTSHFSPIVDIERVAFNRFHTQRP